MGLPILTRSASKDNILTFALACASGWYPVKKTKKPAPKEAGFFLHHVFLRERRYADLGNLLPIFICRASG